ncbi:hypothetical protein HDV00_007599 [Rhizophlyctis rosea]|nr:hypothetical protein HDV00_007599 [Rhizophlyctis rosea]
MPTSHITHSHPPHSPHQTTHQPRLTQDPDVDRKRTLRALALFSYIDRVQKAEDDARRAELEAHIYRQQEEINARAGKLEAKERLRWEESEKRRIMGGLERRQKLYAISSPNGRIPTPLEFLHPSHPYHQYQQQTTPGFTKLKSPQTPTTTDTIRPPTHTTSSASLSQHTTFSTPTLYDKSESSMLLSTPIQTQPHPEALPTHHNNPHHQLHPTNDTLFRGRVYREQASDIPFLRPPSPPPQHIYHHPRPPHAHTLSHIRPRIDSRRGHKTSHPSSRQGRNTKARTVGGRKITREISRKKSASSMSTYEIDRATDAVYSCFGSPGAFEEFRERYREVWRVEKVEALPTLDTLLEPSQTHLTLNRQMYTTAHRNRQRTITFAQSGGTTSKSGTRQDVKPISSTFGLAPFAQDFLHARTDLPVPDDEEVPKETGEKSGEEVDSGAKIGWRALKVGLAVGMIPWAGVGAGVVWGREESLHSRTSFAIAFGDDVGEADDEDVADEASVGGILGLARTSRPTSGSSTGSKVLRTDARPGSGAIRARELAKAKLATGRRGPILEPKPTPTKPILFDDTPSSRKSTTRPKSAPRQRHPIEETFPSRLSTTTPQPHPTPQTPTPITIPNLFAPKPSILTLIEQLRKQQSPGPQQQPQEQPSPLPEAEEDEQLPSTHPPTQPESPSPPLSPSPHTQSKPRTWEPITLSALAEFRQTLQTTPSPSRKRTDSAINVQEHGALVKSLGLGFGAARDVEWKEDGGQEGKVALPNLHRFWSVGGEEEEEGEGSGSEDDM